MVQILGMFLEGNIDKEVFPSMRDLMIQKNAIGEIEGKIRLIEVEEGTLIVIEDIINPD